MKKLILILLSPLLALALDYPTGVTYDSPILLNATTGGSLTLSSTLGVTGTSTFGGNGTFTNNLNVNGNYLGLGTFINGGSGTFSNGVTVFGSSAFATVAITTLRSQSVVAGDTSLTSPTGFGPVFSAQSPSNVVFAEIVGHGSPVAHFIGASGGTYASPSATTTSTTGDLDFGGWDGVSGSYSVGAYVHATPTSLWSGSNHGMRLDLNVTTDGTTTKLDVLRLTGAGVSIAAGSVGDPIAGNVLSLNGNQTNTGTFGLTGAGYIGGALTAASTVTIGGNQTNTGTLGVSGTAYVGGTLTAAGAISVGGLSTYTGSASDTTASNGQLLWRTDINRFTTHQNGATYPLKTEPRVTSLADAATITPVAGTYDVNGVAALSQNTTIAAPTIDATVGSGYQLTLRIITASARTLTWNAAFRWSTTTPAITTTSGSGKCDYFVFVYNGGAGTWDIMYANLGH